MTNFPGALDVLTNPQPTDQLNTPTVEHDQEHANANDAVEACQAKIGITNSTDQDSLDFLSRRAFGRQAAFTYAGTVAIEMDGVATRPITLTGDIQIGTTNRAPDANNTRSVTVVLTAGASNRQVTFAAGVVLLNNTAPITIASGKKALVSLLSTGPNEADTFASIAVQP